MNIKPAVDHAAKVFHANPMGTCHQALRPDNLAQMRCRAAAITVAGDSAYASWAFFDIVGQAANALRPVTGAIDALCGAGLRHGGVAASGYQSDAWAPRQVAKLVGLSASAGAAIGTAAGNLTGARQAAERGAMMGALIGGAVAWTVNQGLALGGLCAKVYLLTYVSLGIGLVTLLEPPEIKANRLQKDSRICLPGAVFQVMQRSWSSLCMWARP